jgi:hypothetical protein
MARPITEIADDLDALSAALKLAFTELDRVIRGQQGQPGVMDQPGAKFELYAEDGRILDLAAMAQELRHHASENNEA